MKYWIGVDLGLQGAITIMDSENKIQTMKIPTIADQIDYYELSNILILYKVRSCHVVFEKLGVIFGTSKATAFSMGYQSGAMEMLCITLGIPYTKVTAKVWQKEMFEGVDEIKKIGKTSRDTKKMALIACQRLFSGVKLTFGDKATKPHDGLIDSVLIAAYCKRHF